jgi:hypothetical protein
MSLTSFHGAPTADWLGFSQMHNRFFILPINAIQQEETFLQVEAHAPARSQELLSRRTLGKPGSLAGDGLSAAPISRSGRTVARAAVTLTLPVDAAKLFVQLGNPRRLLAVSATAVSS